MLPNGTILQQVTKVIIPVMQKDAVLCDCSTVDVRTARQVAKHAEEAELMALDAPVSGGITGAEAGTLTFMAGGSKAGYDIVTPLFEIMGNNPPFFFPKLSATSC